MTEHMNNITKTLIKLLFTVMWWTCLWSLWKENIVQLILTIICVMVIISSSFFIYIYPSIRLEYWWTTYFIWNNLCEGTYFFLININYRYYILQKTKSINTVVSLSTIINGNVNVTCYLMGIFRVNKLL